MEIEDANIKIVFSTNIDSKYNQAFIENLYKIIKKERCTILEQLQISNTRRVKIHLYDDKLIFINAIQKFYKENKIPEYCKGTIQNGEIYFLINKQIKVESYKYEIELRKILHEYI